MKTFRRFKNIINANVNAKLDKLEDPEKMIRLMLSELDETLVDAKTATAERMANRTVIEEELKQAKAAMERWNNRASLAVEKGRDDLAREALIEKTRVTRRVENLEGELAQMDGIISSMQDQISKLETKRQEIRDKQRMLIERAYHAKEKQKVVEILKNIDCSAACRKFNELEEKIERMEADVEMAGFTGAKSKEQEFVDMEHNEAIEAELAKLKAKHTKKQTN
ncbi:MAG: PspA/IM30 family protein [Sphaerochaetaceae bacterium]|jgi:phage shock protein A|nr:PspA/IM30 family protein [Sphaerochaetaceae bacterium]NLO61421.1 phage shock protein A [Spirochaetales bacterium]MDD2406411.1 PspA/IM30 family protein [Sphaerochaetaceae bacterium]MDD3669930.1 PspA/IM30 family protein [Sphaerochaetaceae bacterium]MDD4258551.1 PspA/IM30 family protein [Sphaerochaetaceae bacterium]